MLPDLIFCSSGRLSVNIAPDGGAVIPDDSLGLIPFGDPNPGEGDDDDDGGAGGGGTKSGSELDDDDFIPA